MDAHLLKDTITACQSLITLRFPDDTDRGAAAMLLGDGSILVGTSPDAANASVELATRWSRTAQRFGWDNQSSRRCLHRQPGGWVIVLSPCGVCRERLAVHGPQVLVGVADRSDASEVVWKSLGDVLPDYWMTAFPDHVMPGG